MCKLSAALCLAGIASFSSSAAFGGVVVTTANSFSGLVEGVSSINGIVGSFTDSDLTDPLSNYLVQLNWGDGSTSTGTVNSLGGGSFNVSGNHIYAEEGVFFLTVNVTDSDGSSGTGTGSATIADAALTPLSNSPVPFSPGVILNNVLLGMFGDANALAGLAGDFSVVVNWGDGSTSPGIVSGGGGTFSLTGTHTYNAPGTFIVTSSITDDGGSLTSLQTTASSLPEPASLGLVGAGLLLAALARRRK